MSGWNLFVKGLEGNTYTFILEGQPHEITVEALREKVSTKTNIPVDQQRLIFGGKELQDGNKLSKYGVSGNATLYLVMRLTGGATVERPAIPTTRKIDDSIPRAGLDEFGEPESCMIMATDEDNVEMPCGHVICPEGLMDYSWNEICVNKKTSVLCCLCEAEWDIDIIRRYGGATDEEIALLEQCLSHNVCISDPKVSECPGCKSLCQRKDESKKCVFCTYCSKNKGKQYYFCWECKREWKGSPSNKECGNDQCCQEQMLQVLKNCPTKEIPYLKGLQVPSTRACPTCGTLIEHAGKCKHMTCTVCKIEFCFVCLRKCSEGSSFCGRYSTPCKVAEHQTKIPRRPNP
jgi:hypothetical protein